MYYYCAMSIKNLTEVEAMNESMLDRLVSMENRYEELGHMLMDPDIGTDIKKNDRCYKRTSFFTSSL